MFEEKAAVEAAHIPIRDAPWPGIGNSPTDVYCTHPRKLYAGSSFSVGPDVPLPRQSNLVVPNVLAE